MNNIIADIIFGLCWGDEGKGKISSAISCNYDAVCRWNGGPNAGHTVYVNDVKYKTHIIPSGIFNKKLSIIGPNCVLNIASFLKEVKYLEEHGFDTSLIKVSPKAHIITEDHIKYDLKYLKEALGTTGQGIAPAYSAKMLRTGKLAKNFLNEKYLWDQKLTGNILCEGAQSFWLDINQGDYPYVTSSETLPYGACSLGFSPKKIRDIIGVAKIYDTKSGIDPLFPTDLLEDPELNKIGELGQEFGTTTGRKRIVNWLRIDHLIKAINLAGVTKLIVNKCDILIKLNLYKILKDSKIITFKDYNDMRSFIIRDIKHKCPECKEIIFSYAKDKI